MVIKMEETHNEEKCHIGCGKDCPLNETCNCECENCSHKTCEKKTSLGREWDVWTLSEADIRGVCEDKEIPFGKLTDSDLDEIAHRFKKGFQYAVEDWDSWLAEAINEQLKEKAVEVKN